MIGILYRELNYSYEMGMLSQSVFQDYNNNSWENSSRSNYVYDQNHNLSSTLTESWIDNNWQNWLLVTNYYSSQNKRDSILFQTWENNDWQNDKKTIPYYSENQIDIDSLVAKSWNGLSWINFLKRELVNDANHNQIELLDKIWTNNEWQNEVRFFYSYNKFHFIENSFCELWYNNQWISEDDIIFFQNPDGFITAIYSHNINAYYSEISNADNLSNVSRSGYFLFQNYPNPFNPSTTIRYKIPISGYVNVKIFNILGKEIATLVNEYKFKGIYEVHFDASELPSGVYLYYLRVNDFAENRKMILLK